MQQYYGSARGDETLAGRKMKNDLNILKSYSEITSADPSQGMPNILVFNHDVTHAARRIKDEHKLDMPAVAS